MLNSIFVLGRILWVLCRVVSFLLARCTVACWMYAVMALAHMQWVKHVMASHVAFPLAAFFVSLWVLMRGAVWVVALSSQASSVISAVREARQ